MSGLSQNEINFVTREMTSVMPTLEKGAYALMEKGGYALMEKEGHALMEKGEYSLMEKGGYALMEKGDYALMEKGYPTMEKGSYHYDLSPSQQQQQQQLQQQQHQQQSYTPGFYQAGGGYCAYEGSLGGYGAGETPGYITTPSRASCLMQAGNNGGGTGTGSGTGSGVLQHPGTAVLPGVTPLEYHHPPYANSCMQSLELGPGCGGLGPGGAGRLAGPGGMTPTPPGMKAQQPAAEIYPWMRENRQNSKHRQQQQHVQQTQQTQPPLGSSGKQSLRDQR